MLHHSTEYRLNGGAWIQITPDEEAGSGKTFTISGLAPGSYNVEMRLTPLTGGGPSVVSNSFTLNVTSGNYVAQVQLVQSESASASLKFIATSSQSQNENAEQVSGSLLFIASVAQVQATQSELSSPPGPSTGSVAEFQSVQSESGSCVQTFIGSVIQSQTLQTSAATSAETFAGSVAASQNKQAEAIPSLQKFVGTMAVSQLKQVESATSNQAFTGPFTASVAQSQTKQSESISANIPVTAVEIITNGGFESDLTSWTKSGDVAGQTNIVINTNATYVKAGSKSLKLIAIAGSGVATQCPASPSYVQQYISSQLDNLNTLKLSVRQVGNFINSGGLAVSFMIYTGSHVSYYSNGITVALVGGVNDNWDHPTLSNGQLTNSVSGSWTTYAIKAKDVISNVLTANGLSWSNVNEVAVMVGFEADAAIDDGEGGSYPGADVTFYVDSVTTL